MAKKQVEEKEEIYQKPGYDGRLKYFDNLKEHMAAASVHMMEKNYADFHRLLRIIYCMTKPWLSKYTLIKTKLDAAGEEVKHCTNSSRVSPARIQEMEDSLFDIYEALVEGSKYLWLPGGLNIGEESGDLDLERWMKESSL